MIYLGTPYSHPDDSVQLARFVVACEAAAICAKAQIPCYCPIASWRIVSLHHDLPGDHEFWKIQDKAMMDLCDEGWFIEIEGFSESKGIHHEINYLSSLYKVVRTFNGLEGLQSHVNIIASLNGLWPCQKS